MTQFLDDTTAAEKSGPTPQHNSVVGAVTATALEQAGSPAEWVEADRIEEREVDPLSVSSLYLKLWSETGMHLGTATGFVVRYMHRLFLVTNWHVLSGRRTDNEKPCHSSMAIPHQVRVAHHKGRLGSWQFVGEALYNERGDPRWIEHPRGRAVDVAALEITELPPEARVYVLNLDLDRVHLPTPPGTQVSVIGFPLGLRENVFFGIWKTGHVASDLSIRDDRFLIDATTREGMSGSPVVARRWINEPAEVIPGKPGVLLGQVGRSPMVEVETTLVTKFLGIYSGRIHEDSEIGVVWRPKVIREVLERAAS